MFSINLKFKPIWKSQNRQEGGSGGPLCCGAGVRAESPGGGGPDLDRVEVIVDKIFFKKFRKSRFGADLDRVEVIVDKKY